jgi:tetratricopeptide (TPR) repeat protein
MSRRQILTAGIASIVGALLFFVLPRIEGENFQGAAALVKKLSSVPKPTAVTPTTKDDYFHLTKDISLFSKTVSSLAPEEAAKEWLDLYDRGIALRGNPSQMDIGGGLPQAIMEALPGPESWPELQRLVEARVPAQQPNPWDHALLLLIVHTLNNVEDKQWADLGLLASLSANPTGPLADAGPETSSALLVLGSKLSTMASRADQVEKFWDLTLSALEKAPAQPNSQDEGNSNLELPDLVSLLGEAKAEPLLRRALLLPNIKLSKINGDETEKLARKLALANLDKLQQPPWFLTESLDGSDLYVALLKKFPADLNSSGGLYHVLALVAQSQTNEAVKAVSAFNGTSLEDAATQAAEAGYGMQVYDFLHALLKAQPDSDNWKIYVNLAAQTGHAQDALQFVQDSLARKDLSDMARTRIQGVLYSALLAVDRVDEGIEQLRALIKSAKAAPSGVLNPDGNPNTSVDVAALDLQLARIGHLLKRDSIEAEGLDDAKLRSPKDDLISFLIETGRGVEAEKFLMDAIVDETKKERANPQAGYESSSTYSPNQKHLLQLAQVYYAAGRWDDIRALLEQVPGWGAGDLVEVADQKADSERYSPPSLGLMAARALWETGRTDQALQILDYTLRVDAGDDAAYGLLLKIDKGDLVAKLDSLYQQDQFQNRPLIWKATLLLQQGKVAQAEQACKTAISIDPSDGETGKGDRMRVYSVMADVCDAKKDATQATFFRNVIKAIRLSEDADDYYDAGLLTRAVGMYAKALDLFSDAYCIQSRLARQLAELGRVEEAAVHYRKAFELMPVSFGRMESHCFGCEGAFEGKTATSIAEKTFTDMLARNPKKPQLYYLLGYLYMEEKRYPEAVTNFQKAAELDPDYINAWKQIMDIGDDYRLAPDLRDEAAFNVLRLDPAGRHSAPSTENIRQLAKLWAVEVASQTAASPAPTTLFSLTAAAAQQSAYEDQMRKMIPSGLSPDMLSYLQDQINLRWNPKPKSDGAPRMAVLGNGIITAALQSYR